MVILYYFQCGTYVRRVGDYFSEEDLLVGIEGVDDEAHELSDLGLKGKSFDFSLVFHGSWVRHRKIRVKGLEFPSFTDREELVSG